MHRDPSLPRTRQRGGASTAAAVAGLTVNAALASGACWGETLFGRLKIKARGSAFVSYMVGVSEERQVCVCV